MTPNLMSGAPGKESEQGGNGSHRSSYEQASYNRPAHVFVFAIFVHFTF